MATFAAISQAEVVRTGYTTIVAASSGKCLDINGTTNAGAPAVQLHCTFAGNQQWTVVNAGQGFINAFKIVEQQSGQCLDVSQASTATGATLVQNTCGSGIDELWNFVPVGSNYVIYNMKSNLCVSIQGNSTADDASVVQSACSTATNFLWTVSSGLFANANPVVLQAAHSGQCLVVNPGANLVGSPVVQSPCAGVVSEQWHFSLTTPSMESTQRPLVSA